MQIIIPSYNMNLISIIFRLSFLWVLSLLLIGCGATSTSASPDGVAQGTNQLIKTDAFEGVIFSQENAAAKSIVWKAEGYWTPTQDDILALEQKLGPYLQQTEMPKDRGALKPLTAYKRQYVGFVKQGKPLIYVNFFCNNSFNLNWHEEFLEVTDGGSCYFELKYDPQTGTFFDLSIHGEA